MFQKLRRKFLRHFFGEDPDYQDPFDDAAERLYGRIYLKYLLETAGLEFRGQRVRVLDLGCHTGRISVPLAQSGYEVTGIDSSRFHVRRAQKRADELGLSSRFIKGDGFEQVRRMPANSLDLVLCTEVLYQCPDFQSRMKDLVRVLRPGGLLATSHRTRFFYLTQAIRQKDFEAARFIQQHSEGKLWGSYFNWQTPEELKAIYDGLCLDRVLIRPIGVFTGNGGDGMAALCNLSDLNDSERDGVFEIEAGDSEEFSSLARYLFMIGRKQDV
ncbi:MAG: methyltransferase domain-containing protein [Candidatus Omnitrophica bacterium]|nr:methyltransferase domain-containing protein [Candidatus Omnitrophota bacterium]